MDYYRVKYDVTVSHCSSVVCVDHHCRQLMEVIRHFKNPLPQISSMLVRIPGRMQSNLSTQT